MRTVYSCLNLFLSDALHGACSSLSFSKPSSSLFEAGPISIVSRTSSRSRTQDDRRESTVGIQWEDNFWANWRRLRFLGSQPSFLVTRRVWHGRQKETATPMPHLVTILSSYGGVLAVARWFGEFRIGSVCNTNVPPKIKAQIDPRPCANSEPICIIIM